MWLLLTRQPKPDAAYWPGRRMLAALDAVAWPAVWLLALSYARSSTGVVGLVANALAVLFAALRLRRALWRNERYRFTTWRWGVVFGVLLVFGLCLKAAIWLRAAA